LSKIHQVGAEVAASASGLAGASRDSAEYAESYILGDPCSR